MEGQERRVRGRGQVPVDKAELKDLSYPRDGVEETEAWLTCHRVLPAAPWRGDGE